MVSFAVTVSEETRQREDAIARTNLFMTQGEADGSYQDIPVVTPIRGGQLTNEELLKWLEDDDSSIAELSATSGGEERADETQEEQQALLLDCEIDPYLDDMPTSLPAKGTLATMFGAIVPDREPTISKLRTTKSRVANLLSTIKSRAAPLGLSYIVEDEAQMLITKQFGFGMAK